MTYQVAYLPSDLVTWVVILDPQGLYPDTSVLSCHNGRCKAEVSLGEVGEAAAQYTVDGDC